MHPKDSGRPEVSKNCCFATGAKATGTAVPKADPTKVTRHKTPMGNSLNLENVLGLGMMTGYAILLVVGIALIAHGFPLLGLLVFAGSAIIEWKSNSHQT